MKKIPPFHASLKQATFTLTPCESGISMKQSELDFLWLIQSFNKRLPLFHGFLSKFVIDNHPQTVVAYMEPISKSPTNNDVVQETMLRSQEVAREMK